MGVDWKWVLAESSSLDWIYELTSARDRSLTVGLNKPGSASFSIDVEAPEAALIFPLSTSLICYRKGEPIWSGPIWTINESLSAGARKATVTAMGWFELLNHRILKTGENAPGGPTTTATTQIYSAKDQGEIVVDLINRTNAEQPTGITVGSVDISTPRNRTYARFQNIGQEIVTMSNLESGFDFAIDPLLRDFSIHFHQVKADTTIYGIGRDQTEAIFGYNWGPSNMLSYERSIDGSKTMNQMTAIGKYGQAVANDVLSQNAFGLFEETGALSEVVDPNILAAYAAAEVSVRGAPQVIHTFTPKPFNENPEDAERESDNVPEPFVDYDVGDICYAVVDFGRVKEGRGVSSIYPGVYPPQDPQPMRIFEFTITPDDANTERVSNIQLTHGA